jgi:hypothetical protein
MIHASLRRSCVLLLAAFHGDSINGGCDDAKM